MTKRRWYEVRVRECIEPPKYLAGRWTEGRYIKKSKFYLAKSPKDAAENYEGDGHIISVEKVERERILGSSSGGIKVGGFLTLGDTLLRELKGGDKAYEVKEKRNMRRLYKFKYGGINGKDKETTY